MENEGAEKKNSGRLSVIPTPIGNLEDITLRGLRLLRESDLLLCEDTRTTGRLLSLLQVERPPLLSLHARNEAARVSEVLEALAGGRNVGLVSDAGTPGMSDPGLSVIGAVLDAGFDLDVLPGPTAFVPALLMSGLPALPFHFEGFLPHKKGRARRIEWLAAQPHTVILYESPHRILRLIGELRTAAGGGRPAAVVREITKLHQESPAAVVREITKLHQESIRGSLDDIFSDLSARQKVRGEIVVVMQGSPG